MGNSPYPALDIKTPESPLQQYGQVQQIIGQRQQQQLTQLQIQEQTRLVQDQDATTRALSGLQTDSSGRINYDALPGLVRQNGGSANAVMKATSSIFDMQAKAAETAKNQMQANNDAADAQIKQNNMYRGRLMSIVGITDPAQKQAQWDSEVTKEEQAGTLPPGTLSHTYPGDDKATAFANHFAVGSTLQQEQLDRQKLALEAWKPAGGQLVNTITGEKIGGIPDVKPVNAGLQARWQVLNPGQPLPDFFTLKQGASPSDFDRIDKILQQTETSKLTKAQQEVSNAIRAQTFEITRDKADMQAVTGLDPKTGRQVLLPLSQAQQMGLQNPMKADDDMVNKAMAGRHWLSLAQKPAAPGADPSDMSIMQLVDQLDKSGQLGPLASRYNDFMAGTWGAGNPYVAALRAKMGLSSTLLAQAHVGNRSGAAIIEHFEDLANQKKLDGPTLKAAFGSEIAYVRERAMDPNPPNYNLQGGGVAGRNAGQIQVTDPQGGIHTFADQAAADRFKKLAGIR